VHNRGYLSWLKLLLFREYAIQCNRVAIHRHSPTLRSSYFLDDPVQAEFAQVEIEYIYIYVCVCVVKYMYMQGSPFAIKPPTHWKLIGLCYLPARFFSHFTLDALSLTQRAFQGRYCYINFSFFLSFLVLTPFCLLIVGIECYGCNWSHSMTHTHTHTVGLPWKRDQTVADASTWQHTTLRTDRY